jgi:hypothetical protein
MEKRGEEKKIYEAKYFHNRISTLLYIYIGFLRLFFFSLPFSSRFFGLFFRLYSLLFCQRHTAVVIIMRMCLFFLYV